MIEKKNESLGASFQIPDRVTVRMQLAYFSEAALARGEELFVRLWEAAKAIIAEWKCEGIPLDVDLDEATDPRATEVILWASTEVKAHMDSLERVPKN